MIRAALAILILLSGLAAYAEPNSAFHAVVARKNAGGASGVTGVTVLDTIEETNSKTFNLDFSGATSGNLLIAAMAFRGDGSQGTHDADFTEVAFRDDGGGNAPYCWVFSRVSDGTEGTETWTYTGTTDEITAYALEIEGGASVSANSFDPDNTIDALSIPAGGASLVINFRRHPTDTGDASLSNTTDYSEIADTGPGGTAERGAIAVGLSTSLAGSTTNGTDTYDDTSVTNNAVLHLAIDDD